MKLQELNQNEMTEINGGGLLGSLNLLKGTLSVLGAVDVTAADDTLTVKVNTGNMNNLGNGLVLGSLLNGLNLNL